MPPTQYVKPPVSKWLRHGAVHDGYVLMEILMETLHELVRNSMRSCWSEHPGSTMYDLTRFVTSLRVLQNQTYVHCERGSDHRQKTKLHRGRPVNYRNRINVIMTRGSTAASTALLTRKRSLLKQIGSIPQSISTLDTPNTNGTNATFVD